MAYIITDDCINCTACETECPKNAVVSHHSKKKNVEKISSKHFYIILSKCNECKGFSSIPLCFEICPMKCIIKIKPRKRGSNNLINKQ